MPFEYQSILSIFCIIFIRYQTSTFCMWLPTFQAPLIEKILLFLFKFLGIFIKINLPWITMFTTELSNLFHWPLSHYLDYCRFIRCVIGKCESSNFFRLSEVVVSFVFPYDLQSELVNFCKMRVENLKVLHWNFGWVCGILWS